MPGTFGELVLAARTREGEKRTLSEVGAAIGVDHARVWRIERGLVRPTAREVHGLVQALGLDSETALRLAAEVVPAGDERAAS